MNDGGGTGTAPDSTDKDSSHHNNSNEADTDETEELFEKVAQQQQTIRKLREDYQHCKHENIQLKRELQRAQTQGGTGGEGAEGAEGAADKISQLMDAIQDKDTMVCVCCISIFVSHVIRLDFDDDLVQSLYLCVSVSVSLCMYLCNMPAHNVARTRA